MQEVGASYNHYRRTLRQLADRCEFETITVDQILRDKIVFGIQDSKTLDDSQLVTLKLESGNFLRFQPDTGAQCNVVPLHLYKKATRDLNLFNVAPVSTAIISYGGTSIPFLGKVRLRVWRGDFTRLLDCNLVDS
ncbi:unnamed protein product [Pocillopora meandrina]|uniref:Peptidase A2 domain-containing protein n=1 Tax=Pocillopora meandrina TaxID=46732 RepID=A0AAU9W663_9CNID|nr:unnamed protein product [Pocillopora meandrina]